VIDEFNEFRQRIVVPGPALIIDELISPFEGMENTYSMEGMPAKVKIQRKPIGIGMEFKGVADGMTKIMCFLELQEGKEEMINKDYYDEYGASTSVVLRCTKNFMDPTFYRYVVGDAWFASVKTLLALYKENQLYFIGCVKTAHREYPKKYFESWYETINVKVDRGKHIVAKTTALFCDGTCHDIYGIAWADKKCFQIISNVGLTTAGKYNKT